MLLHLFTAHQDIDLRNIMHRWYDPECNLAELPAEERRPGVTQYCLMDYNISMVHDDAEDISSFQRPVNEAWPGEPDLHPPDYSEGQWQYNPFAMDVACLGNLILSFHAVRCCTSLAEAPH